MSKILTFKSENINLDCIPNRSTIKLETMAGSNNVLDDNIMKALANDNATNENKFSSMDEFLEIVNGKILNISGFPKIFDTDSEFTIPETGWYRIIAVGGGGGGFVKNKTSSNYAKDYYAPKPTIIEIGNMKLIAEAGVTATSKNGAIPLIPYNGLEGATKGGNAGQYGQNGKGKGGRGYENSPTKFTCGGGAGSPFPYNFNKKYAENAKSQGGSGFGIFSEPGYGYGAGGDGTSNVYQYEDSNPGGGGGSSGYLITKDMILIKNEKIKIKIGLGAKVVSTETKPDTYSGSGANGAVAIELLK